jgi:Mrp family chromosome partitioning ATPase
MSRVADAIDRSAMASRGAALPEDDHPWGDDLNDRPAVRRLEDDNPFEPFEPLRPVSPLRIEPAAARQAQPLPPGIAAAPPVAMDEAQRAQLAALVQRLFLPATGEPPRSVAFSGVDADSSLITAAAGELLAQQTGATVCVVDAHFAAPSLHAHFDAPLASGLSNVIDSTDPLFDAARQVRPNLWLLTAGTAQAPPALTSDGVRVRLAQFIARFEFVLIDIEPASSPADGTGLAPLVDGVVLVLAAEATRRESARRATQALQTLGASVLGAVLTNRRFPIPGPLYRRL